MSNIRPRTVYEMTKPNRINPNFIGIGQEYVQHKRKRQQIEKEHKFIQNSLLYAIKTNDNLEKSLEEKQKQLQRLESVRKRHNNDLEKKMRSDEEKRRKLQALRKKSTNEKERMQFNIKQKLTELKEFKKKQKDQIKNRQKQWRQQLFETQEQQLQYRHKMYQTIKEDQAIGNKRVDSFYRRRNLQSLNNYNKLINSQDSKSSFYQSNIQKMNRTMDLFNKKNQSKTKKLMTIEKKIQKLNPFTSFYSTRLNQNQQQRNNMCSSRQTSQKSVSSKKPIQILLEDNLMTSIEHMTKKAKKAASKNRGYNYLNPEN